VGVRQGGRVKIEAISGTDVVEKRSNLVVLMRGLMDSVLAWGEKLIYTGTKDDTLPPRVLKALDAYLAESNSKLLVCMPLRDERETNPKKPARSAALMESFEPATAPEQMVARLEVVARHATPALYNAAEHRRIPMRFLWMPLARLQEGLGGKGRAILTIVTVGLVALIGAMIFVPYPLKMDATGQLLPRQRAYLFSPAAEATVKEFKEFLKPGAHVHKDQELILLYAPQLALELIDLTNAIASAEAKMSAISRQLSSAKGSEKTNLEVEQIAARTTYQTKSQELKAKQDLFNADLNRPGHFWLKSPQSGIVLTADFRDLVGAPVKPSQPLLRIGFDDVKHPTRDNWEIELKIPQKHIGQVLSAYKPLKPGEELDVDLLLVSQPTRSFKGKLARVKIAPEASPNRNENNEAEPVVLAWVRINGDDIPEASRIPPELLLTGTNVHTRIRCGNRAMGYSLFYGVWEFFYENIVFFF
jgi:hypothetical protein